MTLLVQFLRLKASVAQLDESTLAQLDAREGKQAGASEK
jgi:hypothetical protein